MVGTGAPASEAPGGPSLRAPPLSWRLSSHLLHPERRGSMGHGRQAKGASWQAKQHPEAHRWRGEGHPLPVVTALTRRGAAGLQVHGQARLPLAEKLTLQGEVARPSESQPARCSPDGGFPWPGDTAHCGTEPGGRTAPRAPLRPGPWRGARQAHTFHSDEPAPGLPRGEPVLACGGSWEPVPVGRRSPKPPLGIWSWGSPCRAQLDPRPEDRPPGVGRSGPQELHTLPPFGAGGMRTPLCSAGPPVSRDRCPGKALGSSSSHDCHRPLAGHS